MLLLFLYVHLRIFILYALKPKINCYKHKTDNFAAYRPTEIRYSERPVMGVEKVEEIPAIVPQTHFQNK